jgi:hypothetical protein
MNHRAPALKFFDNQLRWLQDMHVVITLYFAHIFNTLTASQGNGIYTENTSAPLP